LNPEPSLLAFLCIFGWNNGCYVLPFGVCKLINVKLFLQSICEYKPLQQISFIIFPLSSTMITLFRWIYSIGILLKLIIDNRSLFVTDQTKSIDIVFLAIQHEDHLLFGICLRNSGTGIILASTTLYAFLTYFHFLLIDFA
jgi:hypothetical protein